MIDTSLAIKSSSSSGISNIFDLTSYRNRRNSQSYIGGFDEILNQLIGNPSFENYLKDAIEGIIYSQWAIDIASNLKNNDDPFDSIYLADLRPDLISTSSINFLNSIADKIVDKSDELIINDGWDD